MINADEDGELTGGTAKLRLGAPEPGCWEDMYHERNLGHKNVRE